MSLTAGATSILGHLSSRPTSCMAASASALYRHGQISEPQLSALQKKQHASTAGLRVGLLEKRQSTVVAEGVHDVICTAHP